MADDARAAVRRQRAAVIAFGNTYANALLGRAQRLAPLEEGTLAASGDVRMVEHPDGSIDWIVTFSTPYARRRHEDTKAQIKVAGRQAKYLEEPAKQMAPKFAAGVAAAIGRVS